MNNEFSDDYIKELDLFIGDCNLDDDNEESLSHNYFKKPFKERLNIRLKNNKKDEIKKSKKRKVIYPKEYVDENDNIDKNIKKVKKRYRK